MGPPDAHSGPSSSPDSEQAARVSLTSGTRARRRRRFWRALPGYPRCKMCTAPLGPPMGPVLALIGKSAWPANPKYCRWCFKALYTNRAGAEVEATFFFADIRGSTTLAETTPPREFRALVDRFYETATTILVDHEAIVDKYVGDEVIGIFVPALSGAEHARQALDAGLELLEASRRGSDAHHAPIGIGVNTGVAYVGAVGTAEHVELTALGDPVNVAARLASAAGAGELLATDEAARASGMELAGVEHRDLDLKGKSAVTGVYVLGAADPG